MSSKEGGASELLGCGLCLLAMLSLQLNYLAVASYPGKVFGWSSGLALMYLPQWVVLFMAAFMGFFGYGLQWLVIRNTISMPYILEILGPKFTVPNQSCCTKNGDSTRAWKYSFRDYNSADDHNLRISV